MQVDIAVIGGGILGLATAWRIGQRLPHATIALLEKEREVGLHQSGRNSGVLHSGIYYRPGSLKAVNCREGKLAMEKFCREHEVPYELCGKVIVAVDQLELPILEEIFRRGQANGVVCRMIDGEELKELEPHAAGVRAIYVPEAGIVDYAAVCRKLAELLATQGHSILLGTKAVRIVHHLDRTTIETPHAAISARLVVNCAGLHADQVARLGGAIPPARIIPFRGEYYQLVEERKSLCRNLIYPVPDPKFPFLGVHFTRMISGAVECGPNAVLAFAREGYRKTHVNLAELGGSLGYRGFQRMAMAHWRTGLGEWWRSISKPAFVAALQRLIPELTTSDLIPAHAGVRAQAVTPDGKLVDDFLITEHQRMVNITNAPSPAATASLNIAALIVDRLAAMGCLAEVPD